MHPGTATLLAKAERAAHAATAALENGAPEIAAGRAFYAILYAAKVVLNERGLRLRTHARIVAALARIDGADATTLSAWLGDAVARRRSHDTAEPTHEDVTSLCARAERAIAIARAHLSG